ncbi:hypothetical protein HS088_TW22G00918 [Tripterygium wilfordii]|uniref:non-specific serine/threonine protein kinase n=1 Tax=Tripterygium wilfordii TaxID=458696 RepID=A0A7J7BZA1_TRIWF|nr:uncharacterized protein LOC119991082 [Tripterygium wilfordii]XP_038693202.1 uncharacterized protein LOC119991082 [Tripterygium wilfordii]XP_038693203.1 uncharacterized protein LOC119991082 [Tripterygium wilfordii]KAF5727229.1 hypothetical protein HS088_TW22G00918 [Tripterygium wilfordii]
MMQQSLHHQQQQLAALLSVALQKDDSIPSTTTTAAAAGTGIGTSSAASSTSAAEDEDSARLSAINSLHRAILYPPNSLLVSHSASFLSQGLSQLLSDKSYSVRQATAIAYGALCAVVCSIPMASNGRQNHFMLGSLVERFINWALPLLRNISSGDGTRELALEGLREFLSAGDVGGLEGYALPILKSCQELLEDERTSLGLLHRLLGVLTLISLKFTRLFQSHFLDIIDLLLGWALVPDLADSDRHIIMDSFLQFQKHWVGHLQFSLGLLTKFLGDMDVLLQDGSQGTPQQFRRLLALLTCFSTVLQSTASGLLEINMLEKISETLCNMVPKLLECLSVVGRRFGWSKWIEDSWKCLTLLAEIVGEKFSTFYPLAVDVLFQSLEMGKTPHPLEAGKITSYQVHGVLKTNLQLLSLQKLGLLSSSVPKVLCFDAPISQLRMHPNHLVTGSSAATYVFFLQHGKEEVVQQALTVLIKELEMLKGMLDKIMSCRDEVNSVNGSSCYSKLELFALIKFDLKVLLTCLSPGRAIDLIGQPGIAVVHLGRSESLVSSVVEKLNPFDLPIQSCVELQVNVVKTLERLTTVEFLSKYSVRSQFSNECSVDADSQSFKDAVIVEHLNKYSGLFVKTLHVSSPVAVKLVSLEWFQRFCENLIAIYENSDSNTYFNEAFGYAGVVKNIAFSVLSAASDREPKVRSSAALVLELLLQARLIHPTYFYPVAEVVLEKLGDPDNDVKKSFVRLLSDVLPTAIYACGLYDCGILATCSPSVLTLGNSSNLHWKQLFALKQLHQQLHSQQLVSILSYLSQSWKLPLSSWIQQLIYSSRHPKDLASGQPEETGNFGASDLWLDVKVEEDTLEKICSVNNLAGAWWAIQEAARYCISTRLRTNLGGPTQTFAALERMLLDIAHVLQLDNERTDGNLTIIGASGTRLLPMRLLLHFVEALKKNVYNAYEGSAILPSASHQSSLFFRTNKKVCEEWFSRICEPMMNAGLALHCYDATIQYCTLRLLELKSLVGSSLKDKSRAQVAENLHTIRNKFSGDILRVLRHMALALCKNHEPEALIGLQKWATITFSSFLVDENFPTNDNGRLGPFAWITGLVYQAEGQYEKAAALFARLLQNEESLSYLGSDGVQFAIGRIIEMYSSVSDWKSLESWLLELQTIRSKHAGKSYSGALTTAGHEINSIHALARFDEGDLQSSWAYLDLTPKCSSELTLDPKLALQRSEQMLLEAMLFLVEGNIEKVPHELEKAKLMLEEILSVLPLDGFPEAAGPATQLHCIFAVEEGDKLKCHLEKPSQHQSILDSYVLSMQSSINRVHQDCNPWLKVLRVYRTSFPTSTVTLKLCVNLLSLSRKQGNLMLGNRIIKYLRDHLLSCTDERYRNFLASNLQYEGCLLMHAEQNFEDAFTNLWSYLRPCMISLESIVPDTDDSILKAKACLKLADWLRQDYPDLSLEDIVLKIWADHNVVDISTFGGIPVLKDQNASSKLSIDVIIEEIVGASTKLSTHLCSKMGKSWIRYASWCFNQAGNSLFKPHAPFLRSCSFPSILVPEILPQRFNLTEDERIRVEYVILQYFQKEGHMSGLNDEKEELNLWLDDYSMKLLVQQVMDTIEVAAGAPGAESASSESLLTRVASQLHSLFVRAHSGVEETTISSTIDDLVKIWWSLRRRRVSLFRHAAHGFIKYLTYSSAKLSDGQLAGFDDEPLKQKAGSYTLRASLYVLHIILNYGVELKDELEPVLSTMPLFPWQEVTPQLFARLSSHPEQVVRKQLEHLLMMLAKLSPWSIVYPTLVDVDASEGKPSEELQHIMGCLRDRHPRLIQDVQLLINELGNVTVLWEELWLSTLQDLHADVMRRINVLKEEAARITENSSLSESEKSKISAAKYSAMMAPIIVALERRLASTSRKPETPHEIWFYEEYREKLKTAISTFRTPPVSAAMLGEVWRLFDDIAASLASHQRKSTISLEEVAPQLALLSFSDVPMPGLEKQVTESESDIDRSTTLPGIATIASFAEQVMILSTKTRPKKLVMLGSDGQRYTYLLKGREDLRLDARIMQLLQAINGFMHSSAATRSHFLGIRYYSVTPISGRAGLIQWVDNVISIYSVFKSWQHRAHLAQLSVVGAGSTKNSVPLPVPRPSDMFYGKIIPALKEKGIRRVVSRRDWPHDVKRKVLLDLMKEVPRQLLHQELWCASEGFKGFSSKLKRYSGTLAAMSMVGHILGLGDRHLDNILVDFSSGDIVHIDYNVCFDKGKRLKVPEIVPFRLTQTIEEALGLTGIEGTFKANCEAVIGALRKNKDIILMLLEVFVWDPLIEWTRGDFHDDAAIGGEERKGMELAVSLSLFASRVQEIRVPLQEHHDLLLATLPAVESALERFADVLNQYECVSAVFHQANQERSNLILHESSAKSIVAEATCNSEEIRASFEIQAQEFAQAKTLVAEKAREATTWTEQHGRILDALRSNSLPELTSCIKFCSMADALSLTSAVSVAGVPLTIVPEPTQAQCQEIDREVSRTIEEMDHGISSALTAVEAYSLALQRFLPLNYLTTSPAHGWAQVLQLCANGPTSEILSFSRRQAAEILMKVHGDDVDSIKCSYDDLCLKMENYALKIELVEEECTELMNSIGFDNESKAKDRLLASFMKYMQSACLVRKEGLNFADLSGQSRYDVTNDLSLQGEVEDRKEKVLYVLNIAVASLYNEVKSGVLGIFGDSAGKRSTNDRLKHDFEAIFHEFEEQVEKCVLLAGFVNELQQKNFGDIRYVDTDTSREKYYSERNWTSIFKTGLESCKILIEQMTEVVLLDVLRSAVSFNSKVMDAFGLISQIRGSIDTALEQVVEVELEKESLVELEQNYFVKVGFVTEQQLALEEAAVKGRDHLSWEEAEEIASQEEACRAQLEELHQTWSQRDMRTASIRKREADIKSSLAFPERHLYSVLSAAEEKEPHVHRSKALLAMLVKPFAELESFDKALSMFGSFVSSDEMSKLSGLLNSGYSLSKNIWKFGGLLNINAFFIWKVGIVDCFFGSCVHDIASSMDQNLGFEQLFNLVKNKLKTELQERIGQYLKDRVVPAMLACLDKENDRLKKLTDATKELALDHGKKDFGAVRRVQLMLEEYCNAHETARAARSAASLMKRQVNELREALRKTSLEIFQMEWVYNFTLTPASNTRVTIQKFLSSEDNLYPIILNLSRPKLLESMQSAVSKIARSVDCLQACEQSSLAAEGQLERAMGWACGGPSSSMSGNNSNKTSGIPPAFHDHLMRRRQFLWEAVEKASDVIKICMSLLEFEASRDGNFPIRGDPYPLESDGRTWQQAYMNALAKLEVTYHSFTRTEQEWKLVQNSMDAASNGLCTATSELSVASRKAKSASGDLQSTVLAMRDCAYETSIALSAFSHVSRAHTALTSESGSMLEEVLAITEDLHDVYSLRKEADIVHHSLMEDLSKVNTILLPLESVLSKDVTAMTDAMTRERETGMEVSPIHGQAIHQSYCSRIREALQAFKPLVPSLTLSVKGLYSMLTQLARTASLHAGNLHKALEGLGEIPNVKSQGNSLSRSVVTSPATELDNRGAESTSRYDSSSNKDFIGTGLSLQDKEWVSPPDSIYSGSSESGFTPVEASLPDSFNNTSEVLEQLSHGSIKRAIADTPNYVPSSQTDFQEILHSGQSIDLKFDDSGSVKSTTEEPNEYLKAVTSFSGEAVIVPTDSSQPQGQENSEAVNEGKNDKSSTNKVEVEDEYGQASLRNSHAGSRVGKGKNAYAMSVLRQVETKLDGRDIAENREVSIAEQVDYLLKQAMSIDNLCNMYEGWTPWI